MDDAELGFNAWVLIPNVLTTELRSATPDAIPDHASLTRLNDALAPVAPPQMLAALAQLSPEDQNALRDAYLRCNQRLGTEAETVLGLPQDAAQAVMSYIENPGRAMAESGK